MKQLVTNQDASLFAHKHIAVTDVVGFEGGVFSMKEVKSAVHGAAYVDILTMWTAIHL